MICWDIGDDFTELHCDVIPINLTVARAWELHRIHGDHLLPECLIRMVSIMWIAHSTPDAGTVGVVDAPVVDLEEFRARRDTGPDQP